MKKFYLLLLISLVSQQFYGQKQNENTDKKGLIEKEQKSFTHKMAIGNNINPNTQNYDLQYQRMDVEYGSGSQQYLWLGNVSF